MARFRIQREYSRPAASVGVKGYRTKKGTLVKRHRRAPVESVAVDVHLQHLPK